MILTAYRKNKTTEEEQAAVVLDLKVMDELEVAQTLNEDCIQAFQHSHQQPFLTSQLKFGNNNFSEVQPLIPIDGFH